MAGYNLYRDAVKVNTVPIGSTSYSDTGLAPGVSHTYTVNAVDAAANESAASTSWSGAAGSGALTTTYTYDTENRLTQLASGGQTIGTYAYDGAGDRVSKTVAGVTTAYTLDLASGLPQVLTETAGSAVTAYAYAGGPLELDRSGATNWYLTDTLGSVRLVTDSTGASPATYAYSAFGSTRASTGTLPNEVRFTGERTDTESGLEFLRARTYDPSVGTFLQRDSWGITATDGQSLDLYLYTENDPANHVDPSGHCGPAAPVCVIAGVQVSFWALGAAGVLAGAAAGWVGYEIGSHPQATMQLVDATYTVVSAPVGITADWVRAGAGWLGGGESFADKLRDMAKVKSAPTRPGRPTEYNPDPDPANSGGPDTGPVGGGNPWKGLPPWFTKAARILLKAGGLSIIGNQLFGEEYPSSKPSPTPSPTPSPKSSSAPTPSPSPWFGGRRQ